LSAAGRVASPAYLADYGALETLDDLRDHPVVRYEGESTLSWTLAAPNGDWVTLQQPVRLTANNGRFLVDMACAGLGMAVMPEFLARQALLEGTLVRVLPDYRLPELALYAVYPQNRYLSGKARALIDFLVEWFSQADVQAAMRVEP